MTPKRIIKFILAGTLIILPVCITACEEKTIDYPARTMPAKFSENASHVNEGEELFQNKCSDCHGKPSEGRSDRAAFFNPPAPDFTDPKYKEIAPAYLYWRIETGKNVEPYRSRGSVMPAWGAHFSEEQIWQLVAYLRHRAH